MFDNWGREDESFGIMSFCHHRVCLPPPYLLKMAFFVVQTSNTTA